MANTICNTVASYLTDLTATNAICSALGATLSFGTNLFIGIEPADKDVSVVTIIPYGGSPPNVDNQRQNPSVQVRVNSITRQGALTIQQSLINELHMNKLSGEGLMMSNDSAPLLIGSFEGGQKTISVSNYTVKHIKI